jgi:molybdopterin/thiamine biosynthesis adenylyltransferase
MRRPWQLLRDLAARRRTGDRAGTPVLEPRPDTVDVRIAAGLFEAVCAHVEDFSRGEEAGFLICSGSRVETGHILLAREWHPIPEAAIARYAGGSVLSWTADLNSRVLQRAVDLDGTPVLVHSHGSPSPRFSADDRAKERPLFGAFSRILKPLPTGTLLLGDGDAVGSFWLAGMNDLRFHRLVVIGDSIDTWYSAEHPPPLLPPRRRLDRQVVAIGPESDLKLARARVAVVGLSGGGSHVFPQLAHQGVGTLIPIDDEIVDATNLGRLMGATESDVDTTAKVAVAKRVATAIDSSITVIPVPARFPSSEAIAALKSADVVVACVDRFAAREAINAFCRRYLIPLVDIGMSIRSTGEQLATADGQVIVSVPGKPCMRCFFITDAVLACERAERPPGYDENPDAPGEPQVVSMNGVLASEACNCVLDLITDYSGGRRGARQWQYDGRTGHLEPFDLPSARPGCPACVEEGHGDPSHCR